MSFIVLQEYGEVTDRNRNGSKTGISQKPIPAWMAAH